MIELNKNTFWRLFLLVLFYFVLGALLRIDALQANVLYADDFLYFVDHSLSIINYDICRFPPQDYRWLTFVYICATGTYFPAFGLSVLPKILSLLFLAFFSTGLFVCIRRWGLGRAEAVLIPMLAVCHPIINEVTLWNITGPYFLTLSLPLVSYGLLYGNPTQKRSLSALALLLIAAFTYEYSLVIFLLFVVAEPFVTRLTTGVTNLNRTFMLVLLFVGISFLYLIVVRLSGYYFAEAYESARGVAPLSNLPAMMVSKIRSSMNLLTNIYMAPLSFFVPLERAWSLWKWLPVTFALFTFVAVYLRTRTIRTGLIYAAFSGAIVLLPLVPLFASTQSPESWRVSIPSLIGFCLGLLPLLIACTKSHDSILGKALVRSLLLILIGILSYVSISESRLRVIENQLENSLVTKIEQFWTQRGVAKSEYRVGRVLAGYSKLVNEVHPAQNISVSYHRRGMQLDLLLDFAWRGRLLAEGFRMIELAPETNRFIQDFGRSCTGVTGACDYAIGEIVKAACLEHPDYVQPETNIRLAHDLDRKVSGICL